METNKERLLRECKAEYLILRAICSEDRGWGEADTKAYFKQRKKAQVKWVAYNKAK